MPISKFHQSLAKLDTCLKTLWTVEPFDDHQIRLCLKNTSEITLELDTGASDADALFSLEDLESSRSFYEVKQVFQTLGLLGESSSQKETEAQTQAWAQLLSDPISIPLSQEASSSAHEGEATPYHVSVLLYLLQCLKKEDSEDLKNLLPLFVKQLNHIAKQQVYAELLAEEKTREQHLLQTIQTEIKYFQQEKKEAKLAMWKIQLAWLEMRVCRENQPENQDLSLIQGLKSEVTGLECIVPTMGTQLGRIEQEANALLDESRLEALIQQLLTLRCDYIFSASEDPIEALKQYKKRKASQNRPLFLKKTDEILEILLTKKYDIKGGQKASNIKKMMEELDNKKLRNIEDKVSDLLMDQFSRLPVVDEKTINQLKQAILQIQGEYGYAQFVAAKNVYQSQFSLFLDNVSLLYAQCCSNGIDSIYGTLRNLKIVQNRYQDKQVQPIKNQIADIKKEVSASRKYGLGIDTVRKIMMMHDDVFRAVWQSSTLKVFSEDAYSLLLKEMDAIHISLHDQWAQSIKEESLELKKELRRKKESLQIEDELKQESERFQAQGIVKPETVKMPSLQSLLASTQFPPTPETLPNGFTVSIAERPEFLSNVADSKMSSVEVQKHTPLMSVNTMNSASFFTRPKFNSKFIVLISALTVLGSGIVGGLIIGAPLWSLAIIGVVVAAGISLGLNGLFNARKGAAQPKLPILNSERLLNAR